MQGGILGRPYWGASAFLVGICSYFIGGPNAEELVPRFGLVAGPPPA